MKNKHRIKQGLSLLLAGALTFTNVGAALPAFAEDAPATPETASAATPETAEANVPTPNLSQITENLYDDLPDAPTGSYLGSMGLPVATGETKIGISAWVSDLYDGVDAHMDADALNADENTVTIGKTPGTDYAIVPLLAQVEYPADGAVSEIILPDDVELLSYLSTDYEPIPADEQEQTEILHQTYSEQSAAATGLYVKASADFTAQLVYTDSDGSSQSKAIHVQISEDAAPTQMYADTGDDGIAAYAAGPTPPYATGKITSIAKEGGTWLIWFNGQEAYCCSHGLNGQPKGCPTYSFSHVSRLEPGQYTPGNHYANQVNIWGGLGQLSLDMLDDRPVVASLEDDPEGCEEQPDILGSLYDETQQWIMENYPDSYAAQTYIAAAEELLNGTDAQSGENGYYTYIYNPPAGYAWQVVALVGEEIAGGTEIPDVPSVPEPKYYSAAWTAPAQSASGSFDLTFTVNTDKYQLNTLEKVDGAVITVTPSRTGGNVDGGSWQMTPAGAQTITTSGHTQDDSFHLNGGDGSATWTVHYEVSKTSTSTLSGQEGPFASQAEADAAAEAAKNAAIGQLQNEAQGMVDAAIASARAQLANITFSYDEITIPHGFDSTPGALGSHQTITVPANSSNDYKMQNDEWSVKVSIDKIDSETKQRIKGDAEFKIFAWDTVRQCYIPAGGYNRYKVEHQSDGTYKVVNHSDYAGGSDSIYYTQRNEGKFVIVESRAPSGYYGDWSDVNAPGTAGSVLGKRAYAFEITKAQDGQTIWLGNADYNADISTTNSGGTLIDTGEGVVTITFGSRNADKTYATDPTGIANNEDSYTMHANADKMQNDRVLGNIMLTKEDLDAARYLAAGRNGDTTLEGAVYDLYAADTIEHPDGVSGIVDYSKITDANGTPLWRTTVLTNGSWDTDYLPILQKDRLVASAKITDGKLAFAASDWASAADYTAQAAEAGRNLISNSAYIGVTSTYTGFDFTGNQVKITLTDGNSARNVTRRLTEYGIQSLRNRKITVSYDYKITEAITYAENYSGTPGALGRLEITFADGTKQHISAPRNDFKALGTAAMDDFARVTATATVLDREVTAAIFKVFFQGATGAIIYKNPKVELGGIATAWTPAPEDTTLAATAPALTQQEVFNRLTNNGQLQGLYMSDGKLYINAQYIAAGRIASVDGKSYFDLNTGNAVLRGSFSTLERTNSTGTYRVFFDSGNIACQKKNGDNWDSIGFLSWNYGVSPPETWIKASRVDVLNSLDTPAVWLSGTGYGKTLYAEDGQRKLYVDNINGRSVQWYWDSAISKWVLGANA